MFFRRNSGPVSWIIIFLGNPGARFDNSRHNVGFFTADAIEEKAGVRINKLKFKSLTAAATLEGARVFFMKPQTYMNLSGDAAAQALNFYKLQRSNLLVVSDDVSLPAGKLRVRRRGSSGGHNGLKDIIAKCGGEDFPRIKIGVGAPPSEDYDLADWVLSKLTPSDEILLKQAAEKAALAISAIVANGIESAMELFN